MFYLQGGEKIKLGRVMMKIVEVNMEVPNQGSSQNQSEDGDQTDSNKTEMSFNEQIQQN